MGKKIFVSYKYADSQVRHPPGITNTTVRDYVDVFQDSIDESDHINKGEKDGEDLSSLADSTIASKLGDKIYDSTVTVVLISKGMMEWGVPEKEQWIPWEISYSLREQKRQNGRSKTNAMLGVVLPDISGSYEWLLSHNTQCNSTTIDTDKLFKIIKANLFNKKEPTTHECNGRTIYTGEHSYIRLVKWDRFIRDIDGYIEVALNIWRNRDGYDIKKRL